MFKGMNIDASLTMVLPLLQIHRALCAAHLMSVWPMGRCVLWVKWYGPSTSIPTCRASAMFTGRPHQVCQSRTAVCSG